MLVRISVAACCIAGALVAAMPAGSAAPASSPSRALRDDQGAPRPSMASKLLPLPCPPPPNVPNASVRTSPCRAVQMTPKSAGPVLGPHSPWVLGGRGVSGPVGGGGDGLADQFVTGHTLALGLGVEAFEILRRDARSGEAPGHADHCWPTVGRFARMVVTHPRGHPRGARKSSAPGCATLVGCPPGPREPTKLATRDRIIWHSEPWPDDHSEIASDEPSSGAVDEPTTGVDQR